MQQEQHKQFNEMLKLIARYDWAVEGFPAPADMDISQQTGINIRNGLVNLAKELDKELELRKGN
jgi:hypothetical protein